MRVSNEDRKRIGDELYERYGRPLEGEHWGEFVAIMPDGRTVLAPMLLEAMKDASAAFGPGGYIFKVGERVAGRIR